MRLLGIFLFVASLVAILGCATPAQIGRNASGQTPADNQEPVPTATGAQSSTPSTFNLPEESTLIPGPGVGLNASPTPTVSDSVEPPISSKTPRRTNCRRQAIGDERFNALTEGAHPTQEELDLMEPCSKSGHERGNRDRGNLSEAEAAYTLPSPVPAPTGQAISGGGGGLTPANFKVAFIGDQGSSASSVSVLELIRDEGADMVLHQGDFDYKDDPDAWDQQINSVLGPDYPYFASVGNHESAQHWPAYQAKLRARLNKIAGATCTGDLGVKSACSYNGLFFILSVANWMGSGHEDFIKDQLAADESIWSISSWHMNQRLMQTGAKRDGTGWALYEECRKGGAIIATGHDHAYARTHLMDNFETQSIASTSKTLMLTRGETFAFVSGLGGVQIRGQDDELAANPWGAAVYNSTNGANYGALFCTFNENGVENRANCYFKDISGRIADDFYLEALLKDGGPQFEGFWEPASGDFSGEFDQLKELAVNTMSFGPSYSPLPDGTYSIRPDTKQFVVNQIVEAHQNGIQVYLVPTFWNPSTRPDSDLAETYLENFTPIVLEWAEIAQEYGVALFSPVNEPDMVFPSETVGAWLHDIIPDINDRYNGLTTTKFAHLSDMNFSGYDYIGFDAIGSRASEGIKQDVALAKQYAERDGARGVFIAEFGVLAEGPGSEGVRAVSGEIQAEVIDGVFRETWGEVDGYFVISWVLPGYSVKGRPAEQVVNQWFTAPAGEPPIKQ